VGTHSCEHQSICGASKRYLAVQILVLLQKVSASKADTKLSSRLDPGGPVGIISFYRQNEHGFWRDVLRVRQTQGSSRGQEF